MSGNHDSRSFVVSWRSFRCRGWPTFVLFLCFVPSFIVGSGLEGMGMVYIERATGGLLYLLLD